jgi:hypothetical protein
LGETNFFFYLSFDARYQRSTLSTPILRSGSVELAFSLLGLLAFLYARSYDRCM